MIRDYISHEIQKALSLIEELNIQEQALEEAKLQRNRQKQKEAEEAAKQKRGTIIKETVSPAAVYHFLAATQEASETNFRTEWQSRKGSYLREDVRSYYEEFFKFPKIDISILPAYSFILQFTFRLAQPYISRDEQDFYVIDNPIRKDKVFGLPYVAPTSWKGSLRAALLQLEYEPKAKAILRLFGNEKREEDQKNLHAGRLYFFPTFFTQKSLEIINPQNREKRAGEKPIPFESVPVNATGTFTLLYVPFDCLGKNEKETCEQVARDIEIVAKGLQAMFRTYGFGAKTSSGFGLVKENVSEGVLKLRIREFERQKQEESVVVQSNMPTLPRYMEAPDRLKPGYVTPEGTFREKSEAELKKMNKSDRQLYDKAKSWWEREGKQLAETAKHSELVVPALSEPLSQAQPISWPKWEFNSFEQLLARADEVVNELASGGNA